MRKTLEKLIYRVSAGAPREVIISHEKAGIF